MNRKHVAAYVEKNIVGALYPGEGELLYDLARHCKGKGVIVEIGSLLGKSTAYLAFGSKASANVKVYAIDPFDGRDTKARTALVKKIIEKGNFFPQFLENMKKAGLQDIVVPIPKRSAEAVNDVKEPIELLFIDGAHSYPYVKMDVITYLPKVVKGGVVAFHDRNRDGVRLVIKQFVLAPNRLKNVKTFKSILYGWKK